MPEFVVLTGSAAQVLADSVSDASVDCAVTSPPYWKKRDYGHPEQLGQEATPQEFVHNLCNVFDQVHRVLVPTGSLWVNLDDTYAGKQLVGVPWMFAFEMQKRGWFLRSDNIWFKPNGSPEPAKNRTSRAHEYLFHFTKIPTGYYFNMDAVREPHTNPWAIDCLKKFAENPDAKPRINLFSKEKRHAAGQKGVTRAEYGALLNPAGKHKRSMLSARYFRLRQDLTPEQISHVLSVLSRREPDNDRARNTGGVDGVLRAAEG